MSYPKGETVGSLIKFLQDNLNSGNLKEDTPISIEIYSLNKADAILKEHEDELGYHIPDDICDECLDFRMGIWSSSPDGECDENDYVALSCYIRE
jgi:hypothetical protein